MIVRTAVHYTHEHPEVTLHNAERLARIERHLRALVAIGVEMVAGQAPERVREWREQAAEEVAPLTRQWLSDLIAFSIEDADEAERTRMRIVASGGTA